MNNMTLDEIKIVRYDLISKLLTGVAMVTYVDFDGVIQTRQFTLQVGMQDKAVENYGLWEAGLTKEQRALRKQQKEGCVKWDDMQLIDQLRTAMVVDVTEQRWRKVNIPYILNVQ